jgi:NAD(P)-dependent dehydrogenase (short-subunit alcohol dehydrogenase family)
MNAPDPHAPRPVLVTGASSGIGLETAVHLARHGFRVFAAVRDLARRNALEAEAARRSVRVEVVPLDVTDADGVRDTVSEVVSRAGSLYGLVNNAGVQLRGYFEDLSPDEIARVFDTNLFGTMAVTRAVLPHLRAAGRGRIVTITSIGGHLGSPALTAYCASKFALEGFSEALALEMKLVGVQVSLVAPAIVRTEIWKGNRHLARGAERPESPYRDSFRRFERLTDRMVASAPTTATDVAVAVRRALTARRPRLRYVVGGRARLLLRLRAYLPGESFERLYRGYILRQLAGPSPDARA